jgi:sialidase-1
VDLTADPEMGGAPYLMMQESAGGGRTWSSPWEMKDEKGERILAMHHTELRLPSGELGLICSEMWHPHGHRGRAAGKGMMFRTSKDEGRTWSEPTIMIPDFCLTCSGHAIILSSGRILAPIFKWISPLAGNEAESWASCVEGTPSFTYSSALFSDDNGKTWQKSKSELFISRYRQNFNLEEPTVVELKDGTILMHLRNPMGRMSRSYSKDQSLSWSVPEDVHVASSSCPSMIKRIPKTGDLLMVWNQSSMQEIVNGLHRTRLSCAISKDEGKTWENFKNLESLDDSTKIDPPPVSWFQTVEQWEDYGYHQPVNTARYHRAPGPLRICYPHIMFDGDDALIVYDVGEGTLGEAAGVKLRRIPSDWFTC